MHVAELAFARLIGHAAIGLLHHLREFHIAPLLERVVGTHAPFFAILPRHASAEGVGQFEGIAYTGCIAPHYAPRGEHLVVKIGGAVDAVTQAVGKAQCERLLLAQRLHILQAERCLVGAYLCLILLLRGADVGIVEGHGGGVLQVAPQVTDVGAQREEFQRSPTQAAIYLVHSAVAAVRTRLLHLAHGAREGFFVHCFIAHGAERHQA